MKDDREETTAYQYAMDTSLNKMEPNLGEKEAVVEGQKIPNEEVTIHSPRACRNKTTACHKATERDTENTEPDPGMMQSVEEHQEVPKEEAVVKPVKGRKKWCRDQNLATVRRRGPKEMTRGDCGAGRKLAAACRKVSSCATVAW
jgi:hypothetical protein